MMPIYSEIKQEESSLPALITLVQYEKSKKSFNGQGELGDNYFAFSIDCRHKKLIGSETDAFTHINKLFTEIAYPVLGKNWLKENFYIFEIPDYSYQAMTPRYVDFVVHIFTNDGKKIPQRYVGLLKSYSKRMCYVLVDKTFKIIDENSSTKDEEGKIIKTVIFPLTFKISFKENIEKDFNETQEIFTDKYDYRIFNKDGNDITNDNYLYDDVISVGSKDIVNRQTSDGNDYFRQIFKTDYDISDANPKKINRESNGIEVSIGSDKKIKSRQNFYEFIELDMISGTSTTIEDYKFSFPEQFELFNRKTGEILVPGIDYTIVYNGNIISTIELLKEDLKLEVELIPYFDARRKFRAKGSLSTNFTEMTVDDFCTTVLTTKRIFNDKNFTGCNIFIASKEKEPYHLVYYDKSDNIPADKNNIRRFYMILDENIEKDISNSETITSNSKIVSDPNEEFSTSSITTSRIGASEISNPFINIDGAFNSISADINNLRFYKDDYLGAAYFTGSDIVLYGETPEDPASYISSIKTEIEKQVSQLKNNLLEFTLTNSLTFIKNSEFETGSCDFILLKNETDPKSSLKYTIDGESYSTTANEYDIILPFWCFSENELGKFSNNKTVKIVLPDNISYCIIGGDDNETINS